LLSESEASRDTAIACFREADTKITGCATHCCRGSGRNSDPEEALVSHNSCRIDHADSMVAKSMPVRGSRQQCLARHPKYPHWILAVGRSVSGGATRENRKRLASPWTSPDAPNGRINPTRTGVNSRERDRSNPIRSQGRSISDFAVRDCWPIVALCSSRVLWRMFSIQRMHPHDPPASAAEDVSPAPGSGGEVQGEGRPGVVKASRHASAPRVRAGLGER